MESLGLGQGGRGTDMKKPSILMGPSLDIHVSYLQVIWVTPPPWYKCLSFWLGGEDWRKVGIIDRGGLKCSACK